MNQLVLLSPGPSITAGMVKSIEESIDCKLPQTYIEFLRSSNGGVPSLRHFCIPGNANREDVLDYFCGIDHEQRHMDLREIIGSVPNYISHGVVPIGITSSGSFVALNLQSVDKCIVYVDIADQLDEEDMKPLYSLADNIQMFCERLLPW